MAKDERWRGQMPFRLNRRYRPEPIKQQGRGGEPSLAYVVRTWWPLLNKLHEQGYNKGAGSFTEHVRQELRAWLEAHGLDHWGSQISFEYRLSRHKRIRVTLSNPRIFHRRLRGDGSKGFMLEGGLIAIDGRLPARRYQLGEFALTRIVGRHPVRLLAEAVTKGSEISAPADNRSERSECQ